MASEIPIRRAWTHGAQGEALLRGIKREDWRSGRQAALRLGRELAERGEIAYWVVPLERREVNRAERRQGPRRPACLRSVKLLDGAYRFLCEGLIRDRSAEGFCLALARDIALPRELAVHIDETAQLREATMIWRRGATIGIRVGGTAPVDALRPSERVALKERYYAIPG